MDTHSVRIKNNKKCNRLDKLCHVLKFLYNLQKTHKKYIDMLENYNELLTQLCTQVFSIENNKEHVFQIFLNSIKTFYNDTLILFTSKSNNIQMINISLNCTPINGYVIYSNDGDINVDYNIYYYINSMRIQYSNKGLIKLIINNKQNIPEDILFIGTDTTKHDTIESLITMTKNNVNNTITKFRIINMKYVQMINNLQNILDNSS